MKNPLIFFTLFFSLLSLEFTYSQTYLEELDKLNKKLEERGDRLEEQNRYNEYMIQLRLAQRQKELIAIKEVKREILETKEATINKILSYDVFANSIIKKELNDLLKDYKTTTAIIFRRYGEKKFLDISEASSKIYSYSMEVLRSKVLKHLSIMQIEKEKLDMFITNNILSAKQIDKIKKKYNEFLSDPFKTDEGGIFIGYTFDINEIASKLSSSATAFAITSDGYLVTNYHVVENSDSIIVKGINGNFEKGYLAELIIADKNNDLSIVKIRDNSFSKIDKIPFTINSHISEVGENVFVLGFPLPSSMGKEIKLTNGIISSKTGFQGDITLYQISAPIQPGNSGGPLFDSKGNLIGIINAKHLGTENVSYAIKSIYLINLIGSLDKSPSISTKNILKTKSLPELVKKVEKFVYIIEVR
ncbi:MAG: trypsin-like peptidase domain-containing protein [Bacteroidetes bacterium]|nr:trypsin-like peptidase domain-containing protein [Bacteroidota bacterium]